LADALLADWFELEGVAEGSGAECEAAVRSGGLEPEARTSNITPQKIQPRINPTANNMTGSRRSPPSDFFATGRS
jgi:hypothetical protein